MIIKCGKCTLRKWKSSDLENLVKNANNYNVSSTLRDAFPYPYTIEDGKEWIEFAENEEWGHNFAITIDDKAVGGIGLIVGKDIERKSSEVGYWLGEDHWGKGIASSALKGIVNFAFNNLKLERIFAVPLEHNTASRKVLEKNDFVLEGILRNSAFKSSKIIDFCGSEPTVSSTGKLHNQALYARIREQ
ncbi:MULTISPECIES: GNAT family N-acetyltransferase [Methanobacterium]|uniref:GNAT family N-acetyltransferase n=1 Tax=Methanobacterium veterum TaxID=408577 RepID=A0A9E4ZXD0_9EURY|nr:MULTISPECIES: GNAT family N-acetyltransferase [Methanobacterium]MCZ3366976.1 GNAT family N-acetyltransferase [Methanobacterium veterum]MCZ3373877.1 GNAT family N-acetyltransferase [Methanobacterium veterum]